MTEAKVIGALRVVMQGAESSLTERHPCAP